MRQPPAVMWFKVYAALMAVIYILAIGFGVVVLLFGESHLDMPREEALFTGAMVSVICLPFLVFYLVSIFLPPKPWVWIYDLVLIAGGFTSCCTLAFSIPLLIFWIKPEVKEYFGRT